MLFGVGRLRILEKNISTKDNSIRRQYTSDKCGESVAKSQRTKTNTFIVRHNFHRSGGLMKNLLEILGVGKENAVSLSYLAISLGVDKRKIREEINRINTE